jgi:hypothetical protein
MVKHEYQKPYYINAPLEYEITYFSEVYCTLTNIHTRITGRSYIPAGVRRPGRPATSQAGGCHGHGLSPDHGLSLLTLGPHFQGQVLYSTH